MLGSRHSALAPLHAVKRKFIQRRLAGRTAEQAQEIARTGINSLKVGFNSVFGYYLEITNANETKTNATLIAIGCAGHVVP